MLRPQQRFLSGAIRLVLLGLDMGSYGLVQLVLEGGVLQVRSGSGPLAESGREAGSGNRSGFAETLEVTMAADLNDGGQDDLKEHVSGRSQCRRPR